VCWRRCRSGGRIRSAVRRARTERTRSRRDGGRYPAAPGCPLAMIGNSRHWPRAFIRCSACHERPSRKVAFPICSVVKAGEPCRGMAWGGEPESLDVGNLWPRKERGHLRVPRGVRLRSPAHRVGRRPPLPGWGGGGVRPVAPTSKPESERTSHNAAPYDPARIVQGDEGIGVWIHQRLSVVGRTVEHPSPTSGLDGGSDQCSEAGSLVIAERVAFDVPRVQSRRKLARQRRLSAASAADHHDPLWDRPSGNRTRRHAPDGMSRGAGSPRPVVPDLSLCWWGARGSNPEPTD
jgi:hypothetical protein